MNQTTLSSINTKWEALFEQKTMPLNNALDLIKYPVITEKTYVSLYANRQYTFDVDKRLTKPQLKKLFENLFDITIIGINTKIPPRKKLRVGAAQGTRPSYKRVIITLKKGEFISYNLKK